MGGRVLVRIGKVTWIGLLWAVLALLAPTVAAAQVAEDSVTGTAILVDGGPLFRFDAHSGPSGESPRGTVTRSGPAGSPDLTAAVTCLAVDGDVATIRIAVGTFPVEESLAFIEDNGAGGDRMATVSTNLPPGCPIAAPPGVTLQPIFSGDIEVLDDAHPLPTSKDQCKNGGWRDFGAFKNLGGCVSFVATGGKNPPASES